MQHELSGIIVVDKPANITSAKVVAQIKHFTAARKAGHTGTLDPFATGVMVCCLNDATRLARFFLHGGKKYEAILHLGVETDTQDLTGKIIATCDEINFSEEKIRSVFKRFEGTIEQFPPVFSALKHNGTALYKLARKGKPIQKPARRIFISDLKILGIKLPDVHFEVSCSAGTYIRALCSDIGKTLGCGGHLKYLRRTESSGFAITEAVALKELETLALSNNLSDKIIGMADALRGMPEYIADQALSDKIMHGRLITRKDIILTSLKSVEGFIKIVDTAHNLLAVISSKKELDEYNYCCVFYK